jgi:hypothetical protein
LINCSSDCTQDATLIGLSALAIHPPFLFEGAVIQQATAADIVEIMATLNAKGDWFRDVAGSEHLEWRPILDYPTDALAREARSADDRTDEGSGRFPWLARSG